MYKRQVTSESHAPVDLIAGTQYLNTRMSPGSQAESQSTLLTGVPAVDLALGDNGLYGLPPIGLKLVSEYLRRAGYTLVDPDSPVITYSYRIWISRQ